MLEMLSGRHGIQGEVPSPLHRQTNLLRTSISGRWRGARSEDQCRVT